MSDPSHGMPESRAPRARAGGTLLTLQQRLRIKCWTCALKQKCLQEPGSIRGV